MDGASRGSFLGLHTRDPSLNVLYVSNGCRTALGFEPSHIIGAQVYDFVYEQNAGDYMGIYKRHPTVDGELEDEDDADVYCWFTNLKNAAGGAVLHKLVSMKIDDIVIFMCAAYPEATYQIHNELKVQKIDSKGVKEDLNVTQKMKSARHKRGTSHEYNPALYRTRNRQAKAAFILENHCTHTEISPDFRVTGPLIAYCTNTNRIIEADTSDLASYP
ncbi:hypothetical protein GGH14_005776, partial [Coemansia sp. RSA 370]